MNSFSRILYFKIYFLVNCCLLLNTSNTLTAQSLCTGIAGEPILFKDFGSGTSQYADATPETYNFRTTYTQSVEGEETNDGFFSFQNSINNDFNVWHTGGLDNTPGDDGGYMFVVNADFDPDEFYRDTVNNLCIGSSYEFSVYLANLFIPTTRRSERPNVLFEIRSINNDLLASSNSGEIEPMEEFTWEKYGLSFTTPTTSVILLMISDAPGGYGNDIAIDDIAFTPCVPATIAITPIEAVCSNAPAEIEVRVFGNADYRYYQWEASTDHGVTYSPIETYGVEDDSPEDYTQTLTVPIVSADDDSTIYRMIVATSVESLSDDVNGCRAFVYSETTLLKVNEFPDIVFPDIPTLCTGGNPYPIPGLSPAGGVISGTADVSDDGVITPSTTGNFEITYTIDNGPGCSDAVTKSIIIQQGPTLAAGDDQAICSNAPSITLDGSVSNSEEFIWTGGTGTFSPDNKTAGATYVPSEEEIENGSVILTFLTTDSLICPSVKDTVNLTFERLPEVNAGPDQVFCEGITSVQLEGSFSNAEGVTWSGGQGVFTPDIENVNATYQLAPAEIAAGEVTLTLTNTGSELCAPDSDDLTINFIPLPTVTIPDTSACVGESILLTARLGNSSDFPNVTPNFQWTKDGVDMGMNQSDVPLLESGVYVVKVSMGECATQDQAIVAFNPRPVPFLKEEFKICSDDTAGSELDAGPGASYIWKPNNETSRTIYARGSGNYSVLVTNEFGCTLESNTLIKDVCPPRLFISDAFSPNSDNTNELYKVYGAHFTNFEMFIFNRWGEIIFSTTDREKVWDGKYLGKPMEIGVYPWIISYEGDSEEYRGPYKKEGSVTLIR